jgi:hypothetical protein
VVIGPGYSKQELLVSENNERGSNGYFHGEDSGDFLVIKRDYKEEDSGILDMAIGSGKRFIGLQHAVTQFPNNSHWPTVVPTPRAQLEALGTSIIANVLPTNPVSSLAQFIGETREGLPSLVGVNTFKQRAALARSAGSEYLNVQFGWLPLISDLKKFAHSVKDSDVLIEQYVRNSGKRVRRVVHLPIDQSVTVTTGGRNSTPNVGAAVSGSNAYASTGQVTQTITRKTERWFVGVFTYHLPPIKPGGWDNNLARNEQLLNYLYGTRPTPETLWNLTPWTWAADWFANTGDVLHNVSAFASDGLVMPYAFIMERKTTIDDTVLVQPYRYALGTKTLRQTFTTTMKQRIRASPFGFGVTFAGLNQRQIAIAAALGLTKGGTKYRYG